MTLTAPEKQALLALIDATDQRHEFRLTRARATELRDLHALAHREMPSMDALVELKVFVPASEESVTLPIFDNEVKGPWLDLRPVVLARFGEEIVRDASHASDDARLMAWLNVASRAFFLSDAVEHMEGKARTRFVRTALERILVEPDLKGRKREIERIRWENDYGGRGDRSAPRPPEKCASVLARYRWWVRVDDEMIRHECRRAIESLIVAVVKYDETWRNNAFQLLEASDRMPYLASIVPSCARSIPELMAALIARPTTATLGMELLEGFSVDRQRNGHVEYLELDASEDAIRTYLWAHGLNLFAFTMAGASAPARAHAWAQILLSMARKTVGERRRSVSTDLKQETRNSKRLRMLTEWIEADVDLLREIGEVLRKFLEHRARERSVHDLYGLPKAELRLLLWLLRAIRRGYGVAKELAQAIAESVLLVYRRTLGRVSRRGNILAVAGPFDLAEKVLRRGDLKRKQHLAEAEWAIFSFKTRLLISYQKKEGLLAIEQLQKPDGSIIPVDWPPRDTLEDTRTFYTALTLLRTDASSARDLFDQLSKALPTVASYAVNRFGADVQIAEEMDQGPPVASGDGLKLPSSTLHGITELPRVDVYDVDVNAGDGDLCVVAVASEWGSGHGGLSTFNRMLCIAWGSARPSDRVYCLVPQASPQEIEEAKQKRVTLIVASDEHGLVDVQRLAQPLPSEIDPDVLIGHGRATGPAASALASHAPGRKSIHFYHVDPEEIEWFKDHRVGGDPAYKADERMHSDLALANTASVAVAVGPRLARVFGNGLHLRRVGVHSFEPGLLGSSHENGPPPGIDVLLLGRAEDYRLKGFDIAARAFAALNLSRIKSPPRLVIRGVPVGASIDLHNKLKSSAGSHFDLLLRPCTADPDRVQNDLGSSSVVLMPSRSEGFGLVGLEAISMGVPVLVSKRSGLAELIEVYAPEFGSSCVVDVVDDENVDVGAWRDAL